MVLLPLVSIVIEDTNPAGSITDIDTLFDDILLFGDIMAISATQTTAINGADSLVVATSGGTFTGSIAGGDLVVTGGTITGFSLFSSGSLVATSSNFNIDAVTFLNTVDQHALGNEAPLTAILDNFSYNVTGGSGNDVFVGEIGDDTINGGNGNDTLSGSGGDDLLIGGAGAGADVLDGGAGNDTAGYTSSGAGVTVRLFDGSAGAGGDAQGDTFTSIENLSGSAFDGTNGVNVLRGGGSDQIFGFDGNDILDGGNNVINPMGGQDQISFDTFGVAGATRGNNTLELAPGAGTNFLFDFNSALDSIDLTGFNFGITGQQVLDQVVDGAGFSFVFLTNAGGVDNFLVFADQQKAGLDASDFITI